MVRGRVTSYRWERIMVRGRVTSYGWEGIMVRSRVTSYGWEGIMRISATCRDDGGSNITWSRTHDKEKMRHLLLGRTTGVRSMNYIQYIDKASLPFWRTLRRKWSTFVYRLVENRGNSSSQSDHPELTLLK
ncbi:hypothetical protein AVEN_80067-1 [Araneus ventricosus]|uniref:Uncharacterized protein n=1 Tax=Araneus ventricosus TaxID=182803 RepID=A0A4Y2M2L0_ARAVE|nr:hypothetical protein AVEN_80067-1 [Araneus ventricosus]